MSGEGFWEGWYACLGEGGDEVWFPVHEWRGVWRAGLDLAIAVLLVCTIIMIGNGCSSPNASYLSHRTLCNPLERDNRKLTCETRRHQGGTRALPLRGMTLVQLRKFVYRASLLLKNAKTQPLDEISCHRNSSHNVFRSTNRLQAVWW